MVPGEIDDDPCSRDVAACEHFRNVVVRHERELHAPVHLRLEVTEKTVFVDCRKDFGRQAPQRFVLRRLLPEKRDEGACARECFFVADIGEIEGALR
jgi:hypothetical protein